MKIELTHPDKLLYPKENITKQDVFEYYQSISHLMLPYIKNRLLSVLRCPRTYEKNCFFQKHPQSNKPPLYSHKLRDGKGKQEYFYIKNKDGLLYLSQLNMIEIHTWGSTYPAIEKPDLICFDLDPSEDVEWKEVIFIAHFIREQLQKIKLKSFVKTTGGRGLHILVPITPQYTWAEVKLFSKEFAKAIETLQPKLCTSSFSKAKRKNKILIDYLRNTRGATFIAPYSVRAKPNAPIATPLHWDQLTNRIQSNSFTIQTIHKMLESPSVHPWQGFHRYKQFIPSI